MFKLFLNQFWSDCAEMMLRKHVSIPRERFGSNPNLQLQNLLSPELQYHLKRNNMIEKDGNNEAGVFFCLSGGEYACYDFDYSFFKETHHSNIKRLENT